MFNLEEYIKRLCAIRDKRLWSNIKLADELDVSYRTLCSGILKGKAVKLITKRKIMNLVNKEEGRDNGIHQK